VDQLLGLHQLTQVVLTWIDKLKFVGQHYSTTAHGPGGTGVDIQSSKLKANQNRARLAMTRLMRTTAPDVQDTAIFSLFAILAAEFASFFGRTGAYAMRAFSSSFRHQKNLLVRLVSNFGGYLFRGGCFESMLGRIGGKVKITGALV
jgi:hypothetical protein